MHKKKETKTETNAMIRKKLFYTIFLFMACHSAASAQLTITAENPSDIQRQELIAVEMSKICQRLGTGHNTPLIVRNAIGQEIDYQVTYDSLLLIDVSVMPRHTASYTVECGVPHAMKHFQTLPQHTAAGGWGVGKVWASGRIYPDRLDDIAWENDRGAYRVYGPAFGKSGAIGFGPDVWVKNTPEADIDSRFRMDIDIKPLQQQLLRAGFHKEAQQLLQDNSFHVDHSTGNDCYAVGATLGCGAPCIVSSTVEKDSEMEVIWQGAWKDYEILDNGPLRFTVALTFPETEGKKLKEHRIYSLDKGSNFNRVEVWYETPSEEKGEDITVAAGFPLRTPNESTVVLGKDFIQYADPTDNINANNCELYIACLFPGSDVKTFVGTPKPYKTEAAVPHALAVTEIKAGNHWVYYAGTAWSKYDVRNQREWQCRIATTLESLRYPLKVTVKGGSK